MRYKSFSYILLLHFCAACSNSKANSTLPNNIPTDTITAFTMPTIPLTLNTPEFRADYLIRHYWDNMNFADTNYVHHPEVTEQAWVDFIDILKVVPHETAVAGIRNLFTKAEKTKRNYQYFIELADKYLYDPNSPMRNEEFYISVLDAMIASPVLSKTEKIRPQARRKLAQKNRVGSKAIDFTYAMASGKRGFLYTIHSTYTLLFINNPGCHACTETIHALKYAPAIGKAIADKRLKIISLYPDEELDEWRKHLSDFPTEWINGYDEEQTIQNENLYDLKAIPTLYLLDKNKMVLLKDVTAEEIDQYLAKQPIE